MTPSYLPINTALLSYGMSGEVFHGPLLAGHPGFHIRAVLQRTPSPGRRHSHRVVATPDEIFNDPDTELVVVNTPNDSHYAHARAALEASKHVVVEKPFTVTTEEANALIRLAQQRGRMLTVFQNRRWDGDFLTVDSVVKEKLTGDLVEFEAHYDRFRDHVDLASWKERGGPGTGVLYNLGAHMIDQALVLFGLPRFVDARVGVQRPGGQVDDFYDIRMAYDKFFVILKSSYLVKEAGPRYVIHGTKGSFVKYGIDPQEQDLKDGRTPDRPEWGTEEERWWGKLNTTEQQRIVPTVPGCYMAFYDNVFDVLRKGASVAVTPEAARDVIAIIESCYQSNASRCAVRIS